jgi:ribosome-binding factor A
MPNRTQKINSLIQQYVSDIITRELSLKEGVFITIPKVDTSADLRYTRVSVSIYPEKEISYALKTLEKETYRIQGILNKKLRTRPLPKIKFQVDMTESKADEIEKILKEI